MQPLTSDSDIAFTHMICLVGPHRILALGTALDAHGLGPCPGKARRPDVSFLGHAQIPAVGSNPAPDPAKGEP